MRNNVFQFLDDIPEGLKPIIIIGILIACIPIVIRCYKSGKAMKPN